MSASGRWYCEILRQEGIQTTYFVGDLTAACWPRCSRTATPTCVTRLVLSHTYPPWRAVRGSVEPAMRLFRPAHVHGEEDATPAYDWYTALQPSPELLLIAAQVRVRRCGYPPHPPGCLSTYLRMMDFDRQSLLPHDLAGWPGKTLIMLAEDDPTTPEDHAQRPDRPLPGATVHMF